MASSLVKQATAHILSLHCGEGGRSSNSAPPDGITKESDSVYKLSEPEGPLKVEIVFIHGLQLRDYKDAYWETWMGGEVGKEICWPKTWLGVDIPGARIWSLTYDSCALRTNTTGRMDAYLLGESLVQEMVDNAKVGQENCPIVFVCHCLGGLVVKEIVIKAHSKFGTEPKYKNFLKNIRGFFFYATPHGGSKLADLAPHVPGQSKMIDLLRVINNDLGRLNADFKRIETDHFASNWQFSVVAERNKTTCYGFSAMVVEEASARHVYNKVLSVAADHFRVCKPQSKECSSYKAIKNFIEGVVQDKLRNDSCFELPEMVGMKERMQEVSKKLEVHSIVGLVGMGGIGKTTLSKHLFNETKKDFEKSCFLEDVKSLGVKASQKQLLSDLCGKDWDEHGREKIKQCIMTKKVLLVVDDPPDDEENLKALLVDAFKGGKVGSKVIVTTRTQNILLGEILDDDDEGIIDMEFLNEDQAFGLFTQYAFHKLDCGDRVQVNGLAKDISNACGGLPLSLEIMGQYLRKYNRPSNKVDRMNIWTKALEKLQNAKSLGGSVDDRLWRTLKISYDDLDDDHRSMFLDFACILCEVAYKSPNKCVNAVCLGRIWGDAIGVQNLINKSLIKWHGDKENLTMHDQLRDMGRKIVVDSTNGKMLRIWQNNAHLKLMLQNQGFELLQGLLLRYEKVHDSDWQRIQKMSTEDVKHFKKLRLLYLESSELRIVEYYVQSCLEALTWLCIKETEITKQSIKKLGSFQQLQVLQIKTCLHLKELPASIGRLSLLIELNLSWCSALKRLPEDIGGLIQLQTLKLEYCLAFVELPASIGQLSLLTELNLSGCSALKRLPECIGDLKGLQILDLHDCYALEELPASIGQLSLLTELYLSRCYALKRLPKSIEDLKGLQILDLHDCNASKELPASTGQLSLLTYLNLSSCSALKRLLETIGDLKGLQRLDLQDCNALEELPASIGQLSLLTKLRLSRCSALKRLPETIGDLMGL